MVELTVDLMDIMTVELKVDLSVLLRAGMMAEPKVECLVG
jgi:hypothetical protein